MLTGDHRANPDRAVPFQNYNQTGPFRLLRPEQTGPDSVTVEGARWKVRFHAIGTFYEYRLKFIPEVA